MAILRLEFDIDGDVYPELLAALSAVASDASRAERLRQLAATGLIWESVRLHGHPASLPVAPAAFKAPPAPAAAAPPARKTPRAAPKAPSRRAAATASDFVDLAIDAAPSPPAFDSDVETVARHLPILMDIVDPVVATRSPPAAGKRAAPAVEPVRAVPLEAAPTQAPAQVVALHDVAGEALDDDLHVAVAPATPSKRSRLARMKEKGLFKND